MLETIADINFNNPGGKDGEPVIPIEGSAQNCSCLCEWLTFGASLSLLTRSPTGSLPLRCLIKTLIRIASKTKPLKTWILLGLEIYKELRLGSMRAKEVLTLNRNENPRFKSEKCTQEPLTAFCCRGEACKCQLFHVRLSTAAHPQSPDLKSKVSWTQCLTVFIIKVILHKL